MLASSFAVVLALYVTGLVRAWRAAGYGRGVRPLDALAFFAGWLVLAVALSPQFDEWTETWLVAHMAQHELLMAVAAPLVAMSAPILVFLWVVPMSIRGRIVASVRRPPIAAAWAALTAPLTVFLLHALALWVWHLPSLYESALAHEWIHAVQHLCFFGTAALFWWGIAHGRYGRMGYGVAVVYVFATAVHGGVLGALLTFSPRVWYAPYSTGHQTGLSPLEDQQLAGLLMWIPAGLLFVVGGLALFAAWLRESDRRTRFKPPRRLTPSEIR